MKIRIKHKLFLPLLMTSVVIAAGLFFYLQRSFDRGFLNYLKGQELEQLDIGLRSVRILLMAIMEALR